MENIGIGIIGCGERIRTVSKLLLEQTTGLSVSAVCDPSASSIAAARTQFGPEVVVYEDYKDLIKDPSVSWIMIGSWNCFHREHAVAALRAGKHVFCEKPLATTLEDALAIRDAFRSSGRRFMLGFPLRYTSHYQKIHQLLSDGAIGQIISLEFNETLDFNHGAFIHQDWRRWRKYAGTHLLEKCCHDIDLVNWCVDSLPTRVASFGGLRFFIPENKHHIQRIGPNPQTGLDAYHHYRSTNGSPFRDDKDIVDHQVAILEYQNGVRVSFHTNCNAAIPERRIYILGSEGTIRADLMTGQVHMRQIGWDEPTMIYPSVAGGHGGGDEVMCRELGRVMEGDQLPERQFEQALCATLTCFAIDQAMDQGQVVSLHPYWTKAGIQTHTAAEVVTRRLAGFPKNPRRQVPPHSGAKASDTRPETVGKPTGG